MGKRVVREIGWAAKGESWAEEGGGGSTYVGDAVG